MTPARRRATGSPTTRRFRHGVRRVGGVRQRGRRGSGQVRHRRCHDGAWSGAPVLADGPHTIVISETNGLDGRTDFATVSFTLDTTPPPTTVQLVSDTGAFATDGITNNPALSGIGDPNAPVLVSIDGGAAVSVATDPTTGLWTYSPVCGGRRAHRERNRQHGSRRQRRACESGIHRRHGLPPW